MNLGEALNSDSSSHTCYGSEFQKPSQLEPVLQNHPLWRRLSSILKKGITFPLRDLDNTTKSLDLENALQFGNHKGVRKHPEFFRQLSWDDILAGYAIPIPLSKIKHMPGAALCPMNVIEQFTISKSGEIVEKQRACHDLSFRSAPSNTSVNSRVIEEQLAPCMFGHCLTRLIHYIISLREKYPTIPIVIQKIDWKSAYRRAHMNWTTAIQCCSIYDNWALIPLRAVFGGSPCPSEWSIVSETACDVANMLLSHSEWNPDDIHSPIQDKIPPPTLLDEEIPFAPARPLIVRIPISKLGQSDVYIDDMIVTVALGTDDYIPRAESAVPLAIHTI